MADDMSMTPSRDDFAALLDESFGGRDFMEGSVVKGKVVGIEKDFAIIDVGLKTEGRIQVKEFGVDDAALAGEPGARAGREGQAVGARRDRAAARGWTSGLRRVW